jgi:phosphonate transport system permease protein
VGQEIELSLRMLAYDEVAAWVLALLALVALVDLASAAVRRRLRASPSVFPASRREGARAAALAAAGVAAIAASLRVLDLSPAALVAPGVGRQLAAFARDLFPPDLSPPLLRALVPAAAQTLAMSVLGTALAAAAGLAIGAVAARRVHAIAAARTSAAARLGGWAATGLARGLLALGRTLPELLWALLFTFVVGLGPFAGALALAVHTAGVLGRLYAEALDEVPDGPLLALRAAGATPRAALVLGVMPQAWPQLAAYTLYRWEVNVRASAILGVVGAGGLGRELYVSLSLFDFQRAATLVLAILVLVILVDGASGWLRARLTGAVPAHSLRSPALRAAASIEA